jgi:hypothetical protein
MQKRLSKAYSSDNDSLICIRQNRANLARELASSLIASHSFMVDSDADQMALIGATALMQALPSADRRHMVDFGRGSTLPWLVLQGIPNQIDLPDTPQGFGDDTQVVFSDVMLLGAMSLAGMHPIAFSYENFGRLLRNVAPARAAENAVSSHGAKLPLEWHTDNAYAFENGFRSPVENGTHTAPIGSPSPKFLCFVGLRNQDANGKPVPTELLPVDEVIQNLPGRMLTELRLPIYEIRPGASNQRISMQNMPLLERCPKTGAELLRFNANEGQTLGYTQRARRAINELAKRLEDMESHSIPILLEPGELLFFDNYRVLHRRGSFEPGPLEKARWLRRCFGTTQPFAGEYVDRIHRPFVWV